MGFDTQLKIIPNCGIIQKEYVITILDINILLNNTKVVIYEANVIISN
jgi:hypothetical protein